MSDGAARKYPNGAVRLALTVGAVVAVLAVAGSLGARTLIVSSPLPKADALLVLAGAPVYENRIARAAAIYTGGGAGLILLTDDGSRRRWSRPLQRNPTSVELAVAALQAAGVPLGRICVLPGRFRGTHEEVRAAVAYAEAHDLRSIVAVTSPFHSRRTVWTLRRFARGSDITIGSDPVAIGVDSPSPWTWWLTSQGWRTVAPEFIKLPYYWLRFEVLASSSLAA